jgi:hypothetical protein
MGMAVGAIVSAAVGTDIDGWPAQLSSNRMGMRYKYDFFKNDTKMFLLRMDISKILFILLHPKLNMIGLAKWVFYRAPSSLFTTSIRAEMFHSPGFCLTNSLTTVRRAWPASHIPREKTIVYYSRR